MEQKNNIEELRKQYEELKTRWQVKVEDRLELTAKIDELYSNVKAKEQEIEKLMIEQVEPDDFEGKFVKIKCYNNLDCQGIVTYMKVKRQNHCGRTLSFFGDKFVSSNNKIEVEYNSNYTIPKLLLYPESPSAHRLGSVTVTVMKEDEFNAEVQSISQTMSDNFIK